MHSPVLLITFSFSPFGTFLVADVSLVSQLYRPCVMNHSNRCRKQITTIDIMKK